MTQTMLAWHNDPALKAEVSARMLQHRIEDGIIQGVYQKYFPELASQYKGCLIGCTLPMGEVKFRQTCPCGCGEPMEPEIQFILWHSRVERLYGIPQVLNHAFDTLFESLPRSRAAWFAVNTIEAIPVGADLSGVAEQLLQDIMDMAKQSRKKISYAPERDEPEWLDWMIDHYLSLYSDLHSNRKAVELAERLLAHLANAPVPSKTETVKVALTLDEPVLPIQINEKVNV